MKKWLDKYVAQSSPGQMITLALAVFGFIE